MKLSKLVGKRVKDAPKDAQTVSHIFLMRGGYVRQMSAGIYALLPLGKRVASKIENIIRQEMEQVDGQEALMPLAMSADYWKETGRYENIGSELLRFKDRNDKEMVLAMTHEEAFTAVVRNEISSYKQLPMMMFQIQTKYRDEARPRAGLIRVREFTMKDGYSFHASEACLESYYAEVHTAYERIFRRIGMKNVVSIAADSGMMGGSVSHEFMALADCGEDILFLSPDKTYRANREIAVAKYEFESAAELPLEEIHTPDAKSIEEIANFMGDAIEAHGKSVMYSDAKGKVYFVMIRGDFEVNESKLKKALRCSELTLATDAQIEAVGSVAGYASPYGLDLTQIKIVADPSFVETSNLTVGANKTGYHLKNFNCTRDLDMTKVYVTDISTVRAGDICATTGEPLEEHRGIEVGNIFQLGTKYSKAMGANYLDQNGKSQDLIMGCYGIGVGRSLASVVEGSFDKYGPIWPISIAPYQVHICTLNANKAVTYEAAEKIYNELKAKGIEVLWDDRNEKPGFIFNDADLIGIPHRIIVSPKTLKEGEVEYKTRDGQVKEMFSVETVVDQVVHFVQEDFKQYC